MHQCADIHTKQKQQSVNGRSVRFSVALINNYFSLTGSPRSSLVYAKSIRQIDQKNIRCQVTDSTALKKTIS